MKQVQQIATVLTSINEGDEFRFLVWKYVSCMQDKGLEVEVQYQQSDYQMSCIIIGRS